MSGRKASISAIELLFISSTIGRGTLWRKTTMANFTPLVDGG